VLTEADLEALVRHADDGQANAGPRVESVVHQPQFRRARFHENGGERRANTATEGV
jgi:hypothetical protein